MPIPNAPTNLQLTSHTTSGAVLTWTDNSSDETGFKVERNLGEGSWTLVTTTAAGATTYTDTANQATTRNNPLRWRVKATNASGDSAATNEVFSTLPPSPLGTPSTDWTAIYPLSAFPRPTRPARGGCVYDPLFGAKIYRVTLESETGSNGTVYSYWMSINADKTRVLEYVAGSPAGRIHALTPNPSPGQPYISGTPQTVPTIPGDGSDGFFGGSSLMWDVANPDVLYGVGAQAIYKYTVSTNTWTLYADADALIPAGQYLAQVQAENVTNPRRFAGQIFSSGSVDEGAIVFERGSGSATTTTLLYSHAAEVDGYNEVSISKNGAYFIVAYSCASGPRCNGVAVIELNNSNFETFIPSGMAPSHWDMTETHLYGTDNTAPGLVKYAFGDHSPTTAEWLHKNLLYVPDWGSYHVSTRAATSIGWYEVEYYADSSGNRPLDGELTLVSMSSPAQVKRFCHSFTDSNDAARYYDTPRANLSLDGTLLAFSSSWGTEGTRRDLYIAETPLTGSVPSGEVSLRFSMQVI